MIVSLWNIRGYHQSKLPFIHRLVHNSDIVILTETWHPLPDTLFDRQVIQLHSPTSAGPRGGVAFILAPLLYYKPLQSVSTAQYQILSISALRTPVIATYLSPKAPPSVLQAYTTQLSRLARGSSIIIGDFNARAKEWDSSSNAQGIFFRNYCARSRFQIHAPRCPTFCNPDTGSISCIDLALSRNLALQQVKAHSFIHASDHRALTFVFSLSNARTVDHIPLTIIENPQFSARISEQYADQLPLILNQLKQARNGANLNTAARALEKHTIEPWCNLRNPPPGRRRPGWTTSLDKKAKQRTKLLSRPYRNNPFAKERVKLLDREIRTEFATNKSNIIEDIGDQLEENIPGREQTLVKRLLSLEQQLPLISPQLNPADYEESYRRLQPNIADIPISHFGVPDYFRNSISSAISTMKPKKAPGKDKIRIEMINLNQQIFGDICFALWQGVGLTASLPNLLVETMVKPIHKKGPKSDPNNYRPISLTSIFRRIISSALSLEIEKVYSPDHSQWGFQKGSNTECAIAFVTNKIRRTLPKAAFLDLRKAYDTVPRHVLLRILHNKLPSHLVRMVTPLLTPTKAFIEGSTPTSFVLITTGVPQGEPSSCILFNIFMDEFIRCTNLGPCHGVSCFADDSVILAQTTISLQKALTEASKWAVANGMSFNVSKSFGLSLEQNLKLAGEPLQSKDEVELLGISINKHGITQTKLLSRIESAGKTLSLLTRLLKNVHLDIQARSSIVKSFVFSQIDYVLYLQPLTASVKIQASALESRATEFILRYKFPQTQKDRAMAMANLPSLRSRRYKHMVNAIHKLYSVTLDQPTSKQLRNWNTLRSFDTIAAFLRRHPLPSDSLEQLDSWKKTRLQAIESEKWPQANKFKRKLPQSKHPPTLSSKHLSHHAKSLITKWYFNKLKIPASITSIQKAALQAILQKRSVTQELEEELQEILVLIN